MWLTKIILVDNIVNHANTNPSSASQIIQYTYMAMTDIDGWIQECFPFKRYQKFRISLSENYISSKMQQKHSRKQRGKTYCIYLSKSDFLTIKTKVEHTGPGSFNLTDISYRLRFSFVSFACIVRSFFVFRSFAFRACNLFVRFVYRSPV